jgi:hypothetical protein
MPSAATNVGAGHKRDISSVIEKLNISSLDKDDIAHILHHCASALHLKTAIDNPNFPLAQSSVNYCYTKSGSSSTVSIWSGGFKVGETSEENARANGIRPCG